jgi:hypothetical protein
MPIKSLLKRLAKAVPVILAHAPAVIAAAKDVKKAVKRPKPRDA